VTAVQRPGWHKPYVGCVTGRTTKALVTYRGYSVPFDTWTEAIEYADAFVQRQVAARAARIARRQARDD